MLKKDAGPPDDELTQRLRAAARKPRPWTWTGIFITLAIFLIPAALLVWWLYPRPEPPHLEVIAFDQLGVPDEKVMLQARLEPVPAPETSVNLDGYSVFFEEGPPPPGPQASRAKTATDRSGEARAEWTFKQPSANYLALYPGDAKRRGTRDQASVYLYPPRTSLLLVDVQNVLSAEGPAGWQRKNIFDIAPLREAGKVLEAAGKKKYHVIYMAVSADSALNYRRMRGWVANREKDGFPPGPVLGRKSYTQEEGAARQEVLRWIREHYQGTIVAVVARPDAAAVCRALDIRTILIGDERGPEDVIHVRSWGEVFEHLPD